MKFIYLFISIFISITAYAGFTVKVDNQTGAPLEMWVDGYSLLSPYGRLTQCYPISGTKIVNNGETEKYIASDVCGESLKLKLRYYWGKGNPITRPARECSLNYTHYFGGSVNFEIDKNGHCKIK